MERYIAFSTKVIGFPSIGDMILDGSKFENIDSAFMAISRYKDDPDFRTPDLNSISDFVLDTQNRILYYIPKNGVYEEAIVNPDYLEKLINDIQN